MPILARALLIAFALACAAAASLLFLPFAALFDAATRDAGLAVMMNALAALTDRVVEEQSASPYADFLGALARAALAVCAAPLVVVALIGEAAGVRAFAWYVGGAGALAAASPWIARAARQSDRALTASPAEARAALLFFLTGAVGGTVYWLIAGRRARAKRS